MHRPIRLLLLYGGQSAEHEISCISARHVIDAADPDRFDIVPVGITRQGKWVDAAPLIEAAAPGVPALPSPDTAPSFTATSLDQCPPMQATASEPGSESVVFPVLHGPGGEDGTVQGLAEVLGLPCVGAGVLASALCMDKWAAKEVLGFHGIEQTPWLGVRAADVSPAWCDLVGSELGFPVFVKPANLGSSIGISKAVDHAGLLQALELALAYDDRIVVEAAVDGREIEVALLGNDEPVASVAGEIATGGAVYDFDAKYLTDEVELLIPASISSEVSDQVRALALRVFVALGVSGMARVDFFLVEPGGDARDDAAAGNVRLLVNEVNTIPGFTPISMYPTLWEASGVSPRNLIDRLVDLALERHRRRSGRRVDR